MAVDKGILTPPVEVISVFVDGSCDKGRTQVSPEANQFDQYIRNEGASHCPTMAVSGDNVSDIMLPGTEAHPLKFRAFSPEPETGIISSWKYIFRNLLPGNRQPQTYVVETEGCDGDYPLTVNVNAYTHVDAKLELSVSYKYTKEKLKKLDASVDKPESSQIEKIDNEGQKKEIVIGNWVYSLGLSGKVDHLPLASQIEILDPSELLKDLRESIDILIKLLEIIYACCDQELGANIVDSMAQSRVDKLELNKKPDDKKTDSEGKLLEAKTSSKSGSISIQYPKLNLSLAYANQETKNQTTLGHSITAELGANPLLGVTCEVDILSALVQIGANALLPGSPAMLSAGKKFVDFIWPIIQKAVSNEKIESEATQKEIEDRKIYLQAGIAIVMKVGANVGASAKFVKKFGDAIGAPVNPDQPASDGPASAALTSGLDFIIEGKAYAKGKALAVEFEFGLMVVAGSAKEAGSAAKVGLKLELYSDGGKPAVRGGAEWSGLAILFATYKEVSVKGRSNGRGATSLVSNDGDSPQQTSSKETSKLADKKYRNQWTIIEPGNYPNNKSIPLDAYSSY